MSLPSVSLRSVAVLALALAGCQKTESASIELVGFPDSLRPVIDQVAPVFRSRPKDASVLYQVAALHAFVGHTDAALATLGRMADLRSGVDPRGDAFGRLEGNPEFQAIRDRIQRDFPPVNRAEPAFVLAAGAGIPEGVVWSEKTRLLYMGGLGTITAVDSTGAARPFVPPGNHRLGGVAGIRVDDSRGEFWATSTKFGGPPAEAILGLFRFRLSDGGLIATYPISDSAFGYINDVAIAPDGSAYATATGTGALLRVEASTGTVEAFLPAGTLPDPNGIAASEDGRYLFVAGWYGIVRVDLTSRETLALSQGPSVASGCIDGLYLTGPRELVGVQNCVHATGRILRFGLSAARDSIESQEVLESYNPLFDGVTTAAVAGPWLYFVANTQLRKLGRDGRMSEPLDSLRILKLRLTDQ